MSSSNAASNNNPNMATPTEPHDPPVMSDIDGPPAPTAAAQSSLVGHHAALSSIFSNFLDNLSAKLPPQTANPPASSAPSTDNDSADLKPAKNIRRTSDLLETLQKALSAPPPQLADLQLPPHRGARCTTAHAATKAHQPLSRVADKDAPCFAASVEIISAVNIARMLVHRNRQHEESSDSICQQQQQQTIEQDPNCYVTFEARHVEPCSPNVIQSPDGQVYATAVMERSTCPEWQQRFGKVLLPEELLSNPSKRFVLKVWRKSNLDSAEAPLKPTPFDDHLVGYAVVNLSELAPDSPSICDWFNVCDVFGRVNGRLQLRVTADSADVRKHRGTTTTATASPGMNIEVEHSAVLNQTIKRKFTELEDITKRLKARLGDVTDDANFEDILDEFENDLNTMPDEETENDDFDWMVAGSDGNSEAETVAMLARRRAASPDGSESVMQMLSSLI